MSHYREKGLLQTVLYEVEQIISNRPMTYYYSDNEESCLTPNHLLHGRTLKYSNLLRDSTPGEVITPNKRHNLLSHFWKRWRTEYLVNLRGSHKPATRKGEHPTIQIGDAVVMEKGTMPSASWGLGKMEGLIKEHDNQVSGAHAKVAKINGVVQRPVSRLYKIEGKDCNVNNDILNQENVNTDSDHRENTSNRPKRSAAVIEELKHKYTSDAK